MTAIKNVINIPASIISNNTTYNIQMFDVIWFQKNLPYRSGYTPCWKSLIITLAFVAWTKNTGKAIKGLSIHDKINPFFLPVWH